MFSYLTFPRVIVSVLDLIIQFTLCTWMWCFYIFLFTCVASVRINDDDDDDDDDIGNQESTDRWM